jgi:hypothetical protein
MKRLEEIEARAKAADEGSLLKHPDPDYQVAELLEDIELLVKLVRMVAEKRCDQCPPDPDRGFPLGSCQDNNMEWPCWPCSMRWQLEVVK